MRHEIVVFEFENVGSVRKTVMQVLGEDEHHSALCFVDGTTFIVEMRMNPLEIAHWKHRFTSAGLEFTHGPKNTLP